MAWQSARALAAPLDADLARACAARIGCRIKQGYGMTELGGSSHTAPDHGPDKPDSIGPALPGVECRVIDNATGAEVGPGELGQLAARERASGQEAHVALEVHDPDTVVLSGLRSLLIEASMRSDGGGYSEHEDATVLYFRADDRPEGIRRLELIAAGRHPAVLAAHLGEPEEDPATRRLQQMTGA
jgi:acyl-CoA synthetase (AMP-forming)/AMP-acid ligase II